MSLHVGFSGTRRGMTTRQAARLRYVLTKARSGPGVLHHGDCVGADAEAHQIAMEAGWRVVIHPPDSDILRARCGGPEDRVTVMPPKNYLARNRDIVGVTSVLVAAPAETDRKRGGTWYTINHAQKRKRVVLVIDPKEAP